MPARKTVSSLGRRREKVRKRSRRSVGRLSGGRFNIKHPWRSFKKGVGKRLSETYSWRKYYDATPSHARDRALAAAKRQDEMVRNEEAKTQLIWDRAKEIEIEHRIDKEVNRTLKEYIEARDKEDARKKSSWFGWR